jgi:voltage-gated potassium channel
MGTCEMFFTLFRFILGDRKRRVTVVAVTLLFCVVITSSVGLWCLESEQSLTYMDCVWMTMATLTTVGYGDLAPKSTGGRLFTIFLPMMFGIGIMAYLLTLMATRIIEKEAKLVNGQLELTCENHILIVNMQHEQKIHALIDELRKDNKSADIPIVLIDSDTEVCPPQLLKRKNFFYIKGNPLWNITLTRANAIKAQQAVILAKDPMHTASDGITLQTAVVLKHMHQDEGTPISLVAEVVCEDSIEPLRIVGVKKIICLEALIPPLLAQALKENSQDRSQKKEDVRPLRAEF